MDRNLGANRVATSSGDVESFGDYYQWGRSADGHQLVNSKITEVKSKLDNPGHSFFIIHFFGEDWRTPSNFDLWQGVNGINNPCPIGFRLPTKNEFEDEIKTWVILNDFGAFNSPLKLPSGGYRHGGTGNINNEGGKYWTSTNLSLNLADGPRAASGYMLTFYYKNALMYNMDKVGGLCIRCIKD